MYLLCLIDRHPCNVGFYRKYTHGTLSSKFNVILSLPTPLTHYTSGIWMWSEPFIRTTKASGGEKLAILLMDTQGMFDNETTMTLTAQIFGLSTLVSSFQVRAHCVYVCVRVLSLYILFLCTNYC